ncbi:MAG TPA: cyclopropane-fatty-acyl-phospholipid synthase family protein [Candidatus Acidoferrales bacterium]|nr:cyclopropane-fatty-acyl-phospholipid synthase family protein [Candidatus Acidoferrales bacterium]
MSDARAMSGRARRGRWDARLAWYFVRKTLESCRQGRLELVCGDRTYSGGEGPDGPDATIVVHDERFFSRVLWREEIGMGESYMDGDWSSLDLVAVARFAIRNMAEMNRRNRLASAVNRLRTRVAHSLRDNSLGGSRRNIRYHYDLSNEFFRLFLDPTMAYSCAYFESAEDSLEQAQAAKYERICRKLMLEPEDHLLELGTGWGGLALYAAQNYGCRVTTTTISRDQHDAARELFRRSGLLGSRIELLSEDYRNVRGQYDKLVSVEMFEAVGFARYDEFFGACDRLLRPDGAMLMQTITVPDQRFAGYRKYTDWIQTYIFPGSELASVGEILKSLGRATRLALHHAEEIGQHYARTLEAWRERFLAALPEVRALGFDVRFIRMWEYYLAICEASFLERNTGNVQLLLAKAGTRKPLWGDPEKREELEETQGVEEVAERSQTSMAVKMNAVRGSRKEAAQSVPCEGSRAGTSQPSGLTTPLSQ